MPKPGSIIAVYMMTNAHNTVLYTGVTADLLTRVWQHKEGVGSQFCKRYNCHYLVWYEQFTWIAEAIRREKRIKRYKREWKENLINELNPDWRDLYEQISHSND